MERNEVEKKIKGIIIEQSGLEETEIKPESKLWENLGLDSLDCVEIVMMVEEEYNKEFPDNELEKTTTVGEFVDYIYSKVNEGNK